MSILYIPFSGGGNKYIENMKEAMRRSRGKIVSLKEFLCSSSARRSTDYVVANWFEDLNSSSKWKNYVRFCWRTIFISYVSFKDKKLIYVMHNVSSHDHGWDEGSARLRRRLLRKSSAVMVLCEKTKYVLKEQFGAELYEKIKSKIYKVCLPNYITCYQPSGLDVRKANNLSNEAYVCSFIGAIRPYKKIELIIDLAKDPDFADKNITFLIAGPVRDESYLTVLKEKVSSVSNVHFMPGFVPDDALYDYVSAANIILLPYDIKSSLNSSSAILAFSCGRNVVIPTIGTVLELNEDLAYTYDYSNELEEFANFKKAVLKSYSDFCYRRSEFDKRQDAVYQYALNNLSMSAIVGQCDQMFSGMENNGKE